MTKTEQIELQELGLTEAQIEARAQKLSVMLNDRRNEAAQDEADTPEKVQALMGAKPKKTRSDKGMKRPAKPAAVQIAPGALLLEQVDRLRTLMEKREQALEANAKAEQAMLEACMAFDQYLDSLTAK